MGLTLQSTGATLLTGGTKDLKTDIKTHRAMPVIALAGNPNVGKSTVFNCLTGLKQHTGNWPGKTVTYAKGICRHKDTDYVLVDLPGTYSLAANSSEEEIARDFICFGKPELTIVVIDATCIERNLNLVLQILELTKRVVVCVNLLDEAKLKKIDVDIEKLSAELGVPVIGTSARKGEGLDALMDAVHTSVSSSPYKAPHDKAPQNKMPHNKIPHEQNTDDSPDPPVTYCEPIEKAVEAMLPHLHRLGPEGINNRWLALRLLEGDKNILDSMEKFTGIGNKERALFMQAREKGLATLAEEGLATLAEEGLSEREGILSKKGILSKEGIMPDRISDIIVTGIMRKAETIAAKTVRFRNRKYDRFDRAVDAVLTSKLYGIPVMLCLLVFVFWLTITGANYPSAILAKGFNRLEKVLAGTGFISSAPGWLSGILINGVYRTLAWVVSVMLPPMAIFFPLFTLLEDIGYLPRIAFNLDNFFKKAHAHGKQALTMCMGFGCNAAGVTGCRIIDSPQERLTAILTNSFVPCNGRFPTLIALSAILMGGIAVSGRMASLCSALVVAAVILASVAMTLAVSWLLSHTILKGLPSSFTLELPPYRKPQVGRIIVRSLLDRTVFVLGRAVMVAAPAGLLIWTAANVTVAGTSILDHCASFLDPFGKAIGMDGCIIMAFILGLPANEIVLPIIIMSYTAAGTMVAPESIGSLSGLLASNGWNRVTILCVMVFTLSHFPCGTTLLTIRKETNSLRWAFVSVIVQLAVGIACCFIIAQTARILDGILFQT